MFVDWLKTQEILSEHWRPIRRFSNTDNPWNDFRLLIHPWNDFRALKIPEMILQRLKLVRSLGVSATEIFLQRWTCSETFFQRSTRPGKFSSVYFLKWFCNIGNIILKNPKPICGFGWREQKVSSISCRRCRHSQAL